MPGTWNPPKRGYHLRVFGLCMLVVFLALLGVLFGVRMEAITHASGIVECQGQIDVRAPLAGLVELGWYEGEISVPSGKVRVRLDRDGRGITRPHLGESKQIVHHRWEDYPAVVADQLRFHQLAVGDELWPGQPLFVIQSDNLLHQVKCLKARLEDGRGKGVDEKETRARHDDLKARLARGFLTVPTRGKAWRAVQVPVQEGQAVQAGDKLARLVPIDLETGQPENLVAVVDVPEKRAAEVAPGQPVRVFSAMFSQRLFGHADGVVARVEPGVDANPRGDRFVRAHVQLTHTPFPLRLGSSVQTEIIVGTKRTYRIILEQ